MPFQVSANEHTERKRIIAGSVGPAIILCTDPLSSSSNIPDQLGPHFGARNVNAITISQTCKKKPEHTTQMQELIKHDF